jgi:hypothetical protein
VRSLLVRCYPAIWRARYGDEFLALLQERPLGPYDVADILLGALDARLRSQHRRGLPEQHGRGFTMSLRIGGVIGAAMLGLAGLMASDLIINVDDDITEATFIGGLGLLLIALTGLSAFQGRAYPATAWTAFGLAAFGVATIAAAYALRPWASEDLWYVFMLGVLATMGGALLFAITTYRTAALSRAGALLIGVGMAVALVQPIMAVGLASIAVGWLVLWIDAIRLDRPATEPRPA